MRKTKKLLSVLLLIAMLSSAMPVLADNAAPAVTESAATSQGFTVRYELNYYLAPKIAARKIAPGEKAPKVNGYARDGWVFAGWSLEKRGPLYDFSTPVTADMTLYAQWIQLRRNNMDAIKAAQETEQETEAPETETEVAVVETEAPETEAPETEALEPEAPETEAPETEAPENTAPETEKSDETTSDVVEIETKKEKAYDNGFNKIVVNADYRDGNNSSNRYSATHEIWTTSDDNSDLEWIIDDYPGTNISLSMSYYIVENGYETYMNSYSFPLMNGRRQWINNEMYQSLAEGENHFNVKFMLGKVNDEVKYGNLKLTVIRKSEKKWENPFTDITVENPNYNVIQYCAQNGYMSGKTPTTFDADSKITNAMLAATLYRVAGSPAVESDKSNWYSDAMAWMQKNNLFFENADPNANVTRKELAYSMLAYAKVVYPNLHAYSYTHVAMDVATESDAHTCGLTFDSIGIPNIEENGNNKVCAICAMGIAVRTGMLPLYVEDTDLDFGRYGVASIESWRKNSFFKPDELTSRADLASCVAGLKQQLFEILKDNPEGFKFMSRESEDYWN